jgi:hypothetical protein
MALCVVSSPTEACTTETRRQLTAPTSPLATMLGSMAEVADGILDALTRYTQPLTGAYYFVPST